jgi:hypothetical protein
MTAACSSFEAQSTMLGSKRAAGSVLGNWRRRRESNPCTRFCRPLPEPLGHVATGLFTLAAPGRFERPLTDPKSAVLPLDDGAPMRSHASRSPLAQPAGQRNGAEDGTRTRDPHLGKVMLYQLSHFRPLVGPDCTASHRCGWCRGPGSNWRHLDFQSSALPTELPRPVNWLFRAQLQHMSTIGLRFGLTHSARTAHNVRNGHS